MKIIIAQTILFTSFVLWITIRYGIQKSISDSWYAGNYAERVAFTLLFAFAIGGLQFFSGSVWFALSGSFLVFVGVAPDFKSEWATTEVVHVAGATGAIVLALFGLVLEDVWWPVIPVALSMAMLSKARNKTFWIEIVAFYSIIAGKAMI
jgi:hypothetical protein